MGCKEGLGFSFRACLKLSVLSLELAILWVAPILESYVIAELSYVDRKSEISEPLFCVGDFVLGPDALGIWKIWQRASCQV